MKTKVFKRILAMMCILVICIQMSSEVLAKIADSSEEKTQTFGITLMHKSQKLNGNDEVNFGYAIDEKNVYRIYSGGDNAEGYKDTVVCLDKNKKFPQEDETNKGTYKSLGKATRENLNKAGVVLTIGEESSDTDLDLDMKYDRLQWLIENAILPEDSEELKNKKLDNIFEKLMEENAQTANPVTIKEIKNVLTEDDLVFALQCAIWKITNNIDINVIRGNTTGKPDDFDGIEGESKGQYIREIINYYATADTSKVHVVGNIVNPEFKEREVKTTTVGTYSFIGPFIIGETEPGEPVDTLTYLPDYTIGIKFEDASGNELEDIVYDLTDKNSMEDVKILPQTKSNLHNKEFYIRVRTTTKAKKIKFKLITEPVMRTTEGTVWVNGANDQPLLSFNREEGISNIIEHEADIDIKVEKIYDVSLRKFITSITKADGQVINLKTEGKTREPLPALIPAGDTDPFNQYIYSHRKDPLAVDVGDKITYTIRVTNEGNQPISVTSITDHLPPEGIEYVADSSIYTNSNAIRTPDTTKRKIVVTSSENNRWVLNPYSIKGPANHVEVQVVCQVTEAAKGKVITNIAEVTGIAYEDGKVADAAGVEIKDIDSQTSNLKLPETAEEWENYKGNEGTTPEGKSEPKYKNPSNLSRTGEYYKGQQDDDDFEKITVKTEDTIPNVDFALRKNITHLNGKEIPQTRIGVINTDPLKDDNNSTTTADYSKDIKNPPVEATVGDVITYKIRVLNEGSENGYASLIEDYLPEGLGFLPEHKGNISNGWVIKNIEGTKNGTVANLNTIENSKVTNADLKDGVTTETATVIKGKAIIQSSRLANTEIKAYNAETDKIDESNFLQLYCIVLEKEFEDNQNEKILRNISAITEYKDTNKTPYGRDIDSFADEKDPETFKIEDHEDDEDYDDVIIKREEKIYDLALKKFISSLTNADGTNKTIPEDQSRRLQVTNVDDLVNRTGNEKVNATYNLNKLPVTVANGDYVTYTIRIFNEGDKSAVVKEVVDTVPRGLEFVPYQKNADGSYSSGSMTNYTYQWENFRNESTTTGWKDGVKTKYLEGKSAIPEFDRTKQSGTNKELGLSYVDLKIEFKVNLSILTESEKSEILKNGIKNIAEITEDDGNDNDSNTNNKVSSEDDEDYDIVLPKEFDLSLRKFITKIDDTDITNREPEVSYEGGKLVYSHTKEPKIVTNGQYVTYTIRVYNEGTMDGYASEITDDIPNGITFLPQNEINQEYGWKMYDANDRRTDDAKEAKKIKTDYLSKDKSTGRSNLIKAFDSSASINENNPSYKDIKVVFEVTKNNVTDGQKTITNTAEITEDEDEYGNDVTDKDSTPGNGDESEDDINQEHIILKYFDLSLSKYVSQVIVTEDGVTKEIDTGYDGTENPEPMVKVEIKKNKLSKTEVKYVYSIKVTNEGEIEGYAKEITDRIPAGLMFFEDDNTEYSWKIKSDGIVTTDYLNRTLLKPGESTIIKIVLRWQNSETNLGQKINTAEISVDSNEYDAPDIDSTPNNNKDGEDDQDNAIVVLSVETGTVQTYIILIITIIAIFAIGFYLMYKYVVKR